MPSNNRTRSKPTEKVTCAQCDTAKGLSNYYTYGGDLRNITKYKKFPICKKCISDSFNEVLDSKLKKKYVYDYCVAMNKPFIHSLYDRADIEADEKEGSNTVKEYFRLVGGASYNQKCFVDGDLSIVKGSIVSDANRELTDEEISRWSEYDFDSEEIMFKHEDLFKTTKEQYGIQDSIENDTNLIALVVLKYRRAGLVKNGDVKEMKPIQATINDLETTLGITKMRSQVAGGEVTFGGFIKLLESTDPYMEQADRFEDVDKLILTSETILASTDVAFGKRDKELLRSTLLKEYEV